MTRRPAEGAGRRTEGRTGCPVRPSGSVHGGAEPWSIRHLPRTQSEWAAISSASAAAKESTSSSVVSNEHIQRTSPVDSSQK